MGNIQATHPVKLIVGLISRNEALFLSVKEALRKRFGRTDFETKFLAFDHTDYYASESGVNLKRLFLSFKKLINPAQLPRIKVFTNKLETRFSKGGKRGINIDPGYVDLAKLVLASTKDFSHRIYLGCGIFAEITLQFRDKSFRPLGWTYPDYKSKDYIDIFNNLRKIYSRQIQCAG